MTANDTKSYLGYLNKSVNEYNNSYVILVKNLLMLIILLWLKKLNCKVPKLVIESDKKSIRITLTKVALKIGQEKYLWLILIWKLILGHMKSKI